MVSSALNITLEELLETLERFRRDYADDPEYQDLRSALPDDFPL
ncbi:MAG: hypothetical protein WD533_08295 [Dehalococcoidia bacterium]